jgi:hypothetical protein
VVIARLEELALHRMGRETLVFLAFDDLIVLGGLPTLLLP